MVNGEWYMANGDWQRVAHTPCGACGVPVMLVSAFLRFPHARVCVPVYLCLCQSAHLKLSGLIGKSPPPLFISLLATAISDARWNGNSNSNRTLEFLPHLI